MNKTDPDGLEELHVEIGFHEWRVNLNKHNSVPAVHTGTLIVNDKGKVVADYNYGPPDPGARKKQTTALEQWSMHGVGKSVKEGGYYQSSLRVTPPKGMSDDKYASVVRREAERFNRRIETEKLKFNLRPDANAYNCNKCTTTINSAAGGDLPPPMPVKGQGRRLEELVKNLYNPAEGYGK